MMNKIRTAMALIAIALVVSLSPATPLSSMYAQTPNPPVRQAPTDQPNSPALDLDHRFAEVARQAPAFGGMFLDGNATLQVYLTDRTQEAAVRQAISAVFGLEVLSSGMKVLDGENGFLQLAEWYVKAHELLPSIAEVNLLDIDEARNRVAIGVETKQGVPMVKGMLTQLGIPAKAVIVEEMEDAIPYSHTLRNTTGNLGGLATFSAPGRCTRGFTAVELSGGRGGFVTNSHCTDATLPPAVDGVMGSTVFFDADGSRAGVEIIDPPIDRRCDGLGGGVITVRCRRSDAAYVQYDDGSRALERGFIARPTSQTTSPGSPVLTISHTGSPFRITDKGGRGTILGGATLHKVGSTTGWTSGPVTATCAGIRQRGGPWLGCQYKVRAFGGLGDSGSPVFATISAAIGATGDVRLHGILWGGNSAGTRIIFSPINAVETELAPLAVCASPFSC
jgi:hypothetical protein